MIQIKKSKNIHFFHTGLPVPPNGTHVYIVENWEFSNLKILFELLNVWDIMDNVRVLEPRKINFSL